MCHVIYQKSPGRIITKYNFTHLLSQAWYQAVTPLNVVAEFCRAGVYPYNPQAITIIKAGGSANTSNAPGPSKTNDNVSRSPGSSYTLLPVTLKSTVPEV